MEDVGHVEQRKSEKKTKKPSESGIIYLSRVPTMMNVNIVRRHFQNFGEVGRIFLQPDGKQVQFLQPQAGHRLTCPKGKSGLIII